MWSWAFSRNNNSFLLKAPGVQPGALLSGWMRLPAMLLNETNSSKDKIYHRLKFNLRVKNYESSRHQSRYFGKLSVQSNLLLS